MLKPSPSQFIRPVTWNANHECPAHSIKNFGTQKLQQLCSTLHNPPSCYQRRVLAVFFCFRVQHRFVSKFLTPENHLHTHTHTTNGFKPQKLLKQVCFYFVSDTSCIRAARSRIRYQTIKRAELSLCLLCVCGTNRVCFLPRGASFGVVCSFAHNRCTHTQQNQYTFIRNIYYECSLLRKRATIPPLSLPNNPRGTRAEDKDIERASEHN